MPVTTIFHQTLRFIRRLRYPGSRRYWEKRYASGGHSGAGSTGLLAAYKAETVNRFVAENGIGSIVELGCGDGQQLHLAQYPHYTGLDIAPSAIARCQEIFKDDASKKFALYSPETFNPAAYNADMALSMEVIFHLTEDDLYHRYLRHLFDSARRWVVIFSANADDTTQGIFPHFRPRRFLPDIPPGWTLYAHPPNPYADISLSTFFFFEKKADAAT